MFDLRFCIIICVNLFISAKCSIPSEKLCANADCTEPISKATGSVIYSSPDENVLNFKSGQHIIIISKNKNKGDYWGAMIEGRTGFVPSHLVKEIQVFHPTEKLITVSSKTSKDYADPNVGTENKGNLVDNDDNSSLISESFLSEESKEKSNLADKTPNILNKVSQSSVSDNEKYNSNNLKQELSQKDKVSLVNSKDDTVINEAYRIIEGTTVYVDQTDEITPSSTFFVNPNPQTAVPASFYKSVKEDDKSEQSLEKLVPPSESTNLDSDSKKTTETLNNIINMTMSRVEYADENVKIEIEGKEEDDDDENDEDEENEGDVDDGDDVEEDEDDNGDLVEGVRSDKDGDTVEEKFAEKIEVKEISNGSLAEKQLKQSNPNNASNDKNLPETINVSNNTFSSDSIKTTENPDLASLESLDKNNEKQSTVVSDVTDKILENQFTLTNGVNAEKKSAQITMQGKKPLFSSFSSNFINNNENVIKQIDKIKEISTTSQNNVNDKIKMSIPMENTPNNKEYASSQEKLGTTNKLTTNSNEHIISQEPSSLETVKNKDNYGEVEEGVRPDKDGKIVKEKFAEKIEVKEISNGNLAEKQLEKSNPNNDGNDKNLPETINVSNNSFSSDSIKTTKNQSLANLENIDKSNAKQSTVTSDVTGKIPENQFISTSGVNAEKKSAEITMQGKKPLFSSFSSNFINNNENVIKQIDKIKEISTTNQNNVNDKNKMSIPMEDTPNNKEYASSQEKLGTTNTLTTNSNEHIISQEPSSLESVKNKDDYGEVEEGVRSDKDGEIVKEKFAEKIEVKEISNGSSAEKQLEQSNSNNFGSGKNLPETINVSNNSFSSDSIKTTKNQSLANSENIDKSNAKQSTVTSDVTGKIPENQFISTSGVNAEKKSAEITMQGKKPLFSSFSSNFINNNENVIKQIDKIKEISTTNQNNVNDKIKMSIPMENTPNNKEYASSQEKLGTMNQLTTNSNEHIISQEHSLLETLKDSSYNVKSSLKTESVNLGESNVGEAPEKNVETKTTFHNSEFSKVNDDLRAGMKQLNEKHVGEVSKTDKGNEDSKLISSVNEEVTEQSGFFSALSEVFSGWLKSDSVKEETLDSIFSNDKKISPESGGTYDLAGKMKSNILSENFDKTIMGKSGNLDPVQHSKADADSESPTLWDSLFASEGIYSIPTSRNTFMYLVITAVTVLLFTLGHNFIEKKGKTGPLIAKINKLEQELLVTSKECLLLKDEILSAKEKIVLYENSTDDELVLSLQAELEESKKTKLELESSIEVLQQELDAATEAGLDLNKMLSEVLTQKGGSESLLQSVESLQAQLDSQQKIIDEMTKKLGVKNQENEALQSALESANDKVENLEEQLSDIKHNLNLHLREKEDLTQELNSQIGQLHLRISQINESSEKETAKAKLIVEDLQQKCKEQQGNLTVKEEECKALKESIKRIKARGNTNLDSLFDVCKIKAELAKVESENQALSERLSKEENTKNSLEAQVKALNLEGQELKRGYEEAAKEKDEAQKKLEVLSTYFKDKETQLQKELGLKEAMWAQKKGDEKAVYNMMKSLQEEVDSYKSQNETLKKEILDQERGLKNQIATLEQKAHENWVAARQAERKLEENKQETAQLRNRLTLIEKNVNDSEGKPNHRAPEELNGVEASSPILHDTSSPLLFPPLPLDSNSSALAPPGFMPLPMFMPPPMGGFIPPPPFLPGDRRPPPLGRMSSPPLNNRFSPPPPPDYSFERMSSPPLSPPARNYRSPNEADRDRERDRFRHRTPPHPFFPSRNWAESHELPGFIPISNQRDSRREQKGSNVSSGHSSSDSLDKSSRHSGRA